ncbi:MAG: long-chain-fatty-acid-CoA ligase [Amphiamblys sp. WSBS2006]|nr:MAG: long-chain-fatty-acid-CoA ligase [Amphiamblys sp. WSBS2006]
MSKEDEYCQLIKEALENSENVTTEMRVKKDSIDNFCYSISESTLEERELGEDTRRGCIPFQQRLFGVDVKTMYELYLLVFIRYGSKKFLGHRVVSSKKAGPYVWKTYKEVWEESNMFAEGLRGIGGRTTECFGIMTKNRTEVIAAEYACHKNNMAVVHVYGQSSKQETVHVMREAELRIVLCGIKEMEKLFAVRGELEKLEAVVVLDDPFSDTPIEETVSAFRERDSTLQFYSWGEVLGRTCTDPVPEPPSGDDICYILYTSGTTGMPKGAVIRHRMFLASISSVNSTFKNELVVTDGTAEKRIGQLRDFGQGNVHLSYLPLAHVLEKLIFSVLAVNGVRAGFGQGKPAEFLDDIQALRPTFLVTVPRVLTKIHEMVLASVEKKNRFAKGLFYRALGSKISAMKRTGCYRHWLWDRLVFSAIRNVFGGRLRGFFCGSAPLPDNTANFIKACFSSEVFQGYGQTETSSIGCVSTDKDNLVGHVGMPFPGVHIRLVDVPELGFTTRDFPYPRGEICMKGENCFEEYYKDEQKTKETVQDGWVLTGDIGMWDRQGRLWIVDRKKNVFKLGQGEYVSPEKIEGILDTAPGVFQSLVYGKRDGSYLVCVVVPDRKYLSGWAEKNGIAGSYEDICKNEKTTAHYLGLIAEGRRSGRLDISGIETPRKLYLEPNPFTVEEGQLTATMKAKRRKLYELYADVFEELYS